MNKIKNRLSSWNEWSPLREIVVGSATNANWPVRDPVFLQEHTKTTWTQTPVPSGPVDQQIIDEANEDLEDLCQVLRNLGIKVHRPADLDFVQLDGMYNYCPRDRFIVAGHDIVDCNMMYPCRNVESKALEMVSMRAQNIRYMPRNTGAILDAANVCRLGKDWLILLSASGNIQAVNWLKEQFTNINIETCSFYSGVHIDSTIVPIREGLVFLNGSRVNETNCPTVFKDWQRVYIHDVVEQNFTHYPWASKWIALNLLMINPHLAIVDKNQIELIRLLELYKVDVLPMQLRHSRTLGGGFHCVTLDLVRY